MEKEVYYGTLSVNIDNTSEEKTLYPETSTRQIVDFNEKIAPINMKATKALVDVIETKDKIDEALVKVESTLTSIQNIKQDVFQGATESSNGTTGFVVAPTINDRNKFLRGDGTWANIESLERTTLVRPRLVTNLVYNGAEQAPSWLYIDYEKMTVSGTTSAQNVGTYMTTFTPKDGYTWETDGTAGPIQVAWEIRRKSISIIPDQAGSITFDGKLHYPSWANFDQNKLDIKGNISGVDAGTYEVIFTPKENYQWSDQTTDSKTATWEIKKKEGNIILDTKSKSIYTDETITFNINFEFDGDIRVYANDNTIASVEAVTTKDSIIHETAAVTVKGLKEGETKIHIETNNGKNFINPNSVNVILKVTDFVVGISYVEEYGNVRGVSWKNIDENDNVIIITDNNRYDYKDGE